MIHIYNNGSGNSNVTEFLKYVIVIIFIGSANTRVVLLTNITVYVPGLLFTVMFNHNVYNTSLVVLFVC